MTKTSRFCVIDKFWYLLRFNKKNSQKMTLSNIKRDQKERKVTKYCRHEEISNVLIKNVLLVCESEFICLFYRKEEKKKLARKQQGSVRKWHFLVFAIINFTKLWREKVANNKSTLRDCVTSSQKPPSEVYKINLENLHCDLTLIFIFCFLNSQKCHGAVLRNKFNSTAHER